MGNMSISDLTLPQLKL